MGVDSPHRVGLTPASSLSEHVHLATAAAGIIGSLFVYGLLQENMMQGRFDGEKFTYSLFLVFCNRILACVVAIVALAGQSMKPVAPTYSYAAVSVSNVVATFCQYEALKYVSFILQTLAKSAKMIPVMIWSFFLSGKVYKVPDYLLALAVSGGCASVAVFGNVKARNTDLESGAALTYGALLMCGYLAFDGFTSTFQERLFKGYQMTIYNQILYVNLFSATFSLFGLVTGGQALPAFDFMLRHPDAAVSVFILSLAAVTGQLCIYYTIRQMGALVYATVMTTRQFVSIIGSAIVYRHSLNPKQWLGVALVVGAGYYKAVTKKSKTKSSAADADMRKQFLTGDEESAVKSNGDKVHSRQSST